MLTAKQFVKKIFEDVKSNWFLPVTEHQIYSTTETMIGTWTDGKPLYRSVFSGNFGTITQGTRKDITVGTVPNVENVASIKAIIKGGGYSTMFPAVMKSDPVPPMNAYINESDGNVIIGAASSGYSNRTAIVTVEYTKTTDTASSPKVPFEPLVEYSTDEKMVGYWIDGKPIYRKTVDCGALTEAGTTKNVAHGIDNLECVIKFEGYAYNSSSGTSIPLPRVGFDNNVFVEVTANATNIIIRPKTNHSTYVRSHVTLYYTKTT